MKKLFPIFLLVIALALPGLTMAAADGTALFKSKMCGACHGAGKMGGDLAASKMDKAAMSKFLKDPKAVKPKAAMPAFKGTDEELGAVVDYVMGLRK